jgi:hypothetical protein
MPWTAWKADPTTDSAARDVLAAYDAAIWKGSPPVECYQAAVDAWIRVHPDQVRTYRRRCFHAPVGEAGARGSEMGARINPFEP